MPCFAIMEWSRHPLRNRPMHSRHAAAAHPVAPPVARAVALALVVLAAALAVPAAHAQYKWIGADGRVNYGDRPPPVDNRRLVRAPAGAHSSGTPTAGDHRLPYALRSATVKYPVVLYTAPDCEPCELGREHLSQRGVPYTEKHVKSAADVRAFNALRFGASPQFPVLTVGSDRMVGFEAARWNGMLDAAAYPRSSMLPPGYLARTLEPMASPEEKHQADAGAARAPSAQAEVDAGGLLIPASQERFENPIRF